MPANALRERLASLTGGSQPRPRHLPPARAAPAEFEPVDTPFGTAWRWEEVLPVGRLRRARPAYVLGDLAPDDFCFVDTETTGLAGGTGTYAFCAAIARPHELGVQLVQLFLHEPSGEPAFLWALARELERTPGMATYNGAAFDLPLLRTRWLLARLPGELPEPRHLDLLHLARGLLRPRLDSCTLRSVEERLLGFERVDDIAGELIPQAYFDHLRQGWSQHLPAVLEHNRQDVLSLQHLLHRLLARLNGEDPLMEGLDWLALGLHLHRRGRRSSGWRALRTAAELGEPRAELMIARRKAILLEWRLHRPAAALRIVEAALDRLGPEADLEKRLARLRKRARRSG